MKQKLFIGDTTHVENIKHLRPNHYIDIELKSIIRFFPKTHIKPKSINEVATEACKMLKGFIKAASLRNKLYMGVTGGYDSRVLFLASLGVECKYYVTKHSNMSAGHYDLVIPQKLTKIFNKKFRVILENPIDNDESLAEKTSIDFPRELKKPDEEFNNHILINGNLSEIARNYYGDFHNVGSKELAVLYGYPGSKFVRSEFNKWVTKSSKIFSENGYNLLDMFYWEEKMGNWAAKAKTEMSILGTVMYSPFCSHRLLTTLLSTSRKQRDVHFNVLYNSIIKKLCPDLPKIPVNPSKKKRIIIFSKSLKVFNISQKISKIEGIYFY